MNSMSKKVLGAIVAVVILAVGAYGAYRVYKHFKRLATPVPGITSLTPSNAMQSLKDLITKGTAMSCAFTEENTQGNLYIAGGKVRGDFESTENGTTTKSHIIDMDNTSYIWMEGQKTGFKTSFNPSATSAPGATAEPSTGANTGFDANKSMDYKCGSWSVDNSFFTLPSGVTFSDMSSLAPKIEPNTSSNSNQCSYCNNLNGDAKTQCLAALNCK